MKTVFNFIFFLNLLLFPIIKGEEFNFPGEIEGKVKVSVMSQDWGAIIWLIENGSSVKKGDVVAKMDPKRVQEELDSKKDSLDRMVEELKSFNKDLEDANREEDVNISQAKLERDLANVRWQEAKVGLYGIALSRLKADIVNAEIEYEKKRLADITAEKLHAINLIDEQSFEKSKLDLDLATLEVELRKNALQIQIKEKEAIEKASKMNYDLKEIQYQKADMSKLNRIQKIKFNINKKEEAIINMKDSIKKDEARLAGLTLITPFDGTVQYKMRSGRPLQVGDRVGRGFAMIDILYTERKKIIIKIEEKSILKFKLGDEANITITDTSEIVKGKISAISTTPRDKNESLGPVGRRVGGYSGITIFDVEVSFEDPQQRYKYGFTATVTFKK